MADAATGLWGAVALLGAVAVIGSLALAGALDDVAVDRGPVLWGVVAAAGAGVLLSFASRPPAWWRTTAIAIGAGVVLAVLAGWAWIRSRNLTGGTPYPAGFLVLAGLGLFAFGAGLTDLQRTPYALRTARVLTGPAALLAVFLVINSFYGYWPTVGALLGHPLPGQVSRRRLARGLHGRASLPKRGEFGPVYISGAAVGFRAARSYLWLPPDFNRVDHADLPVIVTLTGLPGTAEDWARAGGAIDASVSWARDHNGRAPVVLMVNENGLLNHDTECLNSREGHAFSYLTRVIPAWITHVLGIPAAPQRWGVVGFSEGGTCSLMLALTDHDLFGRFVDIAGDAAPDIGSSAARNLRVLYGGNVAAERAHTPTRLLRRMRYPYLEGWFAAGLQDRGHRLLEPTLADDAARAGIVVHRWWAPGHHTWVFARLAFEHLYPKLAQALTDGSHSLRTRRPVPAAQG